jgi:hypothetical protein
MRSTVTATIGRTPDNKVEFGEAYHAVVGRQLNPDFHPRFFKFPQGVKFFELFFGAGSSHVPEDAYPMKGIGQTAAWIQSTYSDETRRLLSEKLSEAATTKSWEESLPEEFAKFWDARKERVLVWLRNQRKPDPYRNITPKAAKQIQQLCEDERLEPVFVGNSTDFPNKLPLKGHLRGFFEHRWFKCDPHSIGKQLWFLDSLYERGGVIASVGMMSGAMDGLAMICGKKVVFLAREKDAKDRMAKVAEAVSNLKWVKLEYENFVGLRACEVESIRAHLVE